MKDKTVCRSITFIVLVATPAVAMFGILFLILNFFINEI